MIGSLAVSHDIDYIVTAFDVFGSTRVFLSHRIAQTGLAEEPLWSLGPS
jgi:hypothetical protein